MQPRTPPTPLPARSPYRPSLKPSAPPAPPPSVTFSELDMVANQEKLFDDDEIAANEQDAPDDEGDGGDGGEEYEYYYEEQDASDSEEEDDEDPELQKAANIAGNTQPDQQFGFVGGAPPAASGRGAAATTGSSTGGYSFNMGGVQRQRQQQQPQGITPGQPEMETAAMTRERIKLIAKLRRKNEKLPEGQRFHIDEEAPLAILRRQTQGASYETKAKVGVLMLRRATLFLSKVIEAASKRYPSVMGDLAGWSENVYLSLDQYDELLYDIYDEYGDVVQGNPIMVFMFALGSNAVMYAMARKILSNPATGKMMQGLAQALNDANNGVKRPAPVAGAVPPLSGSGPSVPVSVAASPSIDTSGSDNPLAGLMGMFSNAGGGAGGLDEMLGNLDMDKLVNSLGAIMGGNGQVLESAPVSGDHRGSRVPELDPPAHAHVQEMQGMEEHDARHVMEVLRKQEDLNRQKRRMREEAQKRHNPPMAAASHKQPEEKYQSEEKYPAAVDVAKLMPPPPPRQPKRSGSRLSFPEK